MKNLSSLGEITLLRQAIISSMILRADYHLYESAPPVFSLFSLESFGVQDHLHQV
jgi:hypothetical protein